MEIVPTNTHQRVAQWQAAFSVIKATVLAGEEVLVHCVAGRHRAAAVGVLRRTMFTAEPIAQSDAWISQWRSRMMQVQTTLRSGFSRQEFWNNSRVYRCL